MVQNNNTNATILNRELSLLEFQSRVLDEANNPRNPMLEKVKFLSIFGSNMDEFFMVRVSGIFKQVEAKITNPAPDGLTPKEQLIAIRKKALELYKHANSILREELLPGLEKEGIHLIEYRRLNARQKSKVNEYFCNVVFPVLTPLALDPGHPFPHISNLSLNLAIVIKNNKGEDRFARLKIPPSIPPLVPILPISQGIRKDGSIMHHQYFVWLHEVIAANLSLLFPGMQIVEAHPFRVIRDADIEIQEIEAEDLLESMQQSIRKRKFGEVIQVAIQDSMPKAIRNLLIENFEIHSSEIYPLNGVMQLANFSQIYSVVDRPDLKYPPFRASIPISLRNVSESSDFFDAIREKDILIHHPYDSFNPVIDFLTSAARDPKVLAIKQTLYRVGQNSPIVNALLEASERGKQVAVLVELKARFDEESNISWALTLEQAGVHVVYGVLGLKTHSKTGMVIRKEGDGIRRYLHLATGNYNPITANFYEDVGLFTCDETLAADITDLFNFITGYSTLDQYRKILVAPVNLRSRLEELIRREMDHARNHCPAYIIIKVNSVVDTEMINLLYEASQTGVRIDLLVRGMCCLIPGKEGLSENIRVFSIVGRFLEHSRIFYFQNNHHEEVFLGSADLMTRNLSHRVEMVFPLENEKFIRYIRDDVLETYLNDNLNSRKMENDGSYIHLSPMVGQAELSAQNWLINHSRISE